MSFPKSSVQRGDPRCDFWRAFHGGLNAQTCMLTLPKQSERYMHVVRLFAVECEQRSQGWRIGHGLMIGERVL